MISKEGLLKNIKDVRALYDDLVHDNFREVYPEKLAESFSVFITDGMYNLECHVQEEIDKES